MYSSHAAIIAALALPLLALVVAVFKGHSVWSRALRRWTTWQRALAVGGVAVAVMYGGDKPGPVMPPEDIV